MKKLLAFVAAVIFTLSLSMAVFAEEAKAPEASPAATTEKAPDVKVGKKVKHKKHCHKKHCHKKHDGKKAKEAVEKPVEEKGPAEVK
ncbi:MAG: hypothetical protein HQK94_19310 [Nitrospirae bacterium]|nr:hypothetical protein [Nitrospirota bacterium]